MTTIETIRRLDHAGLSGRQIADELGINRETVSKYLNRDDFSPQPPPATRQAGATALRGLTHIIEGWLADDARRGRKQRHTAKRAFDRLVAEHDYQGSYSPVQRFVKDYRARHRSPGGGYLELVWAPGTAQVDFGQAEAIIAGIRQSLHILVVSFPFSNMRFAQAFRAETSECIGHGLRTIFEHIDSVPTQLILDNATAFGRRCGQVITESALFAAFKAHYRTSARYCNAYSGNEKGNVENAVGFIRRNLMVPEPDHTSLGAFNTVLLNQCDDLAALDHWKKAEPIKDLFTQDQAAGLALPGIGFDPVRYESRRADKTGTVLIDSHAYLAGPAYHSRLLTAAIRHDEISILDEHSAPILTFERVFGAGAAATSMHPATLLPALMTKPGAWSNSPVRDHVPDPVKDWCDRATNTARSKFFARLDATTTATSLDAALDAAADLIGYGDDPTGPSLAMLAYRHHRGSEPAATNADLSVYTQFTTVKEATA